MRRSRQVILVIVAALIVSAVAINQSSGKGDDEAQPRVRTENVADLARFRGITTTTSTTTTVPPTTTTIFVAPTTLPPPPTTLPPPPPPPPPPAPSIPQGTVWDALAQCESGGNWQINTGNGYYGGLQFLDSTWDAMGTGYDRADLAPREVQIEAATRLQAQAGWGQWPACSAKLGL